MPATRTTTRPARARRVAAAEIDAVRRFNRLVTRRIGALGERHLDSEHSLTEVRVLWELAHREETSATAIARALALDAGYLSRLLREFAARGWLARRPAPHDAREQRLALTRRGRAHFAALDRAASSQVGALLGALDAAARQRLVGAMHTVESLLDDERAPRSPGSTPAFVLRDPRPGDLGWVVHRHGVLYAEEYGWDERFEGLVATIVGEFVANRDPARERCWIAERDGAVVGSVFLVRKSATVAKLRLLYVEPAARGAGIGAALVDACIDGARAMGYRRLTLWTQRNLSAARRIYARAGFARVEAKRHSSFGKALTEEIWERAL